MAQGGINYKDNKQFIGGDHGLDCFRAAFQVYGENVNNKFQEIRNILAKLSLRLDGRGVTSAINMKTRHHNHPMQYCSKIEPPTFNGYLDREAFLVWCSKVEDYLDTLEVPEDRQAKYVAFKLRGAALAWWETLQNNRRRQGKPPVQSWRKMRKLLAERFLLVDYQQDHFQRYQPYTQGSLNVNKYNEFLHIGSRCNLSKNREKESACHNNMGGLRINIQERMPLTQMNLCANSNYFKCEEPSYPSNECRAWKSVNLVDNECTEEGGLDENEKFESLEEAGEHLSCVVQKVLYPTKEKWQTENKYIFRPDYRIPREVWNFVIDDGSIDNTISKTLLQCLGFSTESRSKSPCKLGWIKEWPSVEVTEICHISLLMGKSYEDTIRLWQSDVNTTNHQKTE